jgi:hypothetical protein
MTLWEEVFSENHPNWHPPERREGDVGGPFFVLRHKKVSGAHHVDYTDKSVWIGNPQYDVYTTCSGNILPCDVSQLEYPPSIESDDYQMNMMGAEAVAKAAPGTSPMNLAVSLAELKKDGLPSMIGSTFKDRTGKAKAAGSEYLNVQFGWAPLVRDVKSLAKTVSSAGNILSQLERDAGKVVRRRVVLKDESEVVSSDIIGLGGVNCAGQYNSALLRYSAGTGQLRRTVTKTRRVWFSGAFTYYLPPSYYSRNKIMRASARANELLGLDLTPQVLWNITPWSWAVDWFSNADEVISNTTRFLSEGLVMHHGYLMEHTIHEYSYSLDEGTVPPVVLITETKGRVKANPFGFGVEFPSLNGFQLSILAALGLSRRG